MAEIALDPKAVMEPKDPAGVEIPYSIDWTKAVPTGDTITGSTWSVSPSGLTQDATSIVGLVTTVALSGGTADTDYTVTNQITTNTGYIDKRSLLIPCRLR
jgi:hypothetical protein